MSSMKGGRRIPTPMPPPKEMVHQSHRPIPRLVGSEASYRLSHYEVEALNAVKATAPKMDRNGYFFYAAATAKKKKISLMQPRPPRVAFIEEKRRPGVAERVNQVYQQCELSTASAAVVYRRVDSMTQRGASPAPRARLYTQLENYQPRYHTIRDSDKRVESECRRRKKDQSHSRVPGQPQVVLRNLLLLRNSEGATTSQAPSLPNMDLTMLGSERSGPTTDPPIHTDPAWRMQAHNPLAIREEEIA